MFIFVLGLVYKRSFQNYFWRKIILSVICSCFEFRTPQNAEVSVILNPNTFLITEISTMHLSKSFISSQSPVTQLPVPEQLEFKLSQNGDDEIRTHDPRLARAVLSQLSYVPESIGTCDIGNGPGKT